VTNKISFGHFHADCATQTRDQRIVNRRSRSGIVFADRAGAAVDDINISFGSRMNCCATISFVKIAVFR
jgi:hypothetical protein